MAFITPVAARVIEQLKAEFPGIKIQTYYRRKIAGKSVWSQHSWPNALDIYFTAIGDTSGAHMNMLDEVHSWLKANVPEIRYLLWRTTSHFDHIHVDFWPKGYGIPSLERGGDDNLYMQRDGTIITQQELEEGDSMAILSDDEQRELQLMLKLLKDNESSVYFVGPTVDLIRKEREKNLHVHGEIPDQFDPNDYEIIIQRKEV